jgi:hypothetical protein
MSPARPSFDVALSDALPSGRWSRGTSPMPEGPPEVAAAPIGRLAQCLYAKRVSLKEIQGRDDIFQSPDLWKSQPSQPLLKKNILESNAEVHKKSVMIRNGSDQQLNFLSV